MFTRLFRILPMVSPTFATLPRRPQFRRGTMVGIGKTALAVLALSLITVVGWQAWHGGQSRLRWGLEMASSPSADPAQPPAPARMAEARYIGVDGNGQPYGISAAEAIQRDGEQVELHTVEADILANDGIWLALLAPAGVLDLTAKTMHLTGGVEILGSDGNSIQSPTLAIDLRTNMIRAASDVVANGPLGSLNASGATIWRQEQRAVFHGPVRMRLLPVS